MSRRTRGRQLPPEPPRPGVSLAAALAVVAVILAGAAVVLTLTRTPGADASACRTLAWDSLPAADTLPDGWSLNGSGFFADGYSTSFVGPAPTDSSSAAPNVYVRVSCVGSDDHLALTRSHDAAIAAGSTDLQFADLGDESYATQDASGGMAVYLRRSGLVAYLVASSGVDRADLEQTATAVDDAIVAAQTTGGPAATGTSAPATILPGSSGSPAASGSPGASATQGDVQPHEAAALEALLPRTVNGVTLTTQSTTGTTALGDSPSSQALLASLQGFGKGAADLKVAEAYDASGTLDIDLIGYQVAGVDAAKLRQAIVASWLAAGSSGVTTAQVTIGGKQVIRIDYGDGSALDYLYQHGDLVVDVSTGDATLAGQVLGLLP
ncbi:MAG: hypothetical protein ACXVAE_06350 [Candidatus Limnocylindrales bacterium]